MSLNVEKIIFDKISIVIFLFLIFILAWLCGQLSVDDKEIKFTTLVETSTSCTTTTKNNDNRLIIYTTSEKVAKNLTKKLCENKVVSRQYGSVVGYWGHKTSDSFEFVGKGIADLVLAKSNIMAAFKAQSTYNYQPVIGFSDYTAFFISAKEKPRLTKQYFLDKRIGMLDYPTSRSGHLLPKKTLKELGLSIKNLNITYANTHNELRELLAEGKVDIIASFWKDSDKTRFSENYITPLSDNIKGTRWYFKMQQNNTDLLCAIQSQLLDMSKDQSLHYYQNVKPFWQCSSDGVHFIKGNK